MTVAMPFDAHNLYSARAVRALESAAMENGLSGEELMQRAGAAVFALICRRFSARRPLAVLCGGGNNGGDGYVVARLAAQSGWPVRVFTAGAGAPQSRVSAAQKESAIAAGAAIAPLAEFTPDAETLIVDALLGTGVTRDVDAAAAELFARINDAAAAVIAVDVPSGLCCDSGKVYGSALAAGVTVTFIAKKPGLFTGRGAHFAGEVLLDTLGIAGPVYDSVAADARLLGDAHLKTILHRRAGDAHKHAAGHVLVLGGGRGMGGAAVMAAEGAVRAGAGLVTLCTEDNAAARARPEVMTVELGELRASAGRFTAAVAGPGLGAGAFAVDAFATALELGLPMVVDADALNLLAQESARRDNWVLTPHPGEAARLLGVGSAAVQAGRLQAAADIAGRYGGVCALKGAGTVIADGGQTWLCAAGNPGMAAAGMGDVLSGVIGAFIAQGYGVMDGACCGVQLHAAAGDVAAADGAVGMAATDLPPLVRRLHNRLLDSLQ
ncbi:MAG: NAD(P)H-hydrate dehydratase [Gammaproteobacteria bacterium]|nr:NAD(P)H-hydrate dehydratase [Gammaproteobacteria bacterium]